MNNETEIESTNVIRSDTLANHNQKSKKRHGARNQHKMKYFVQWLHENLLHKYHNGTTNDEIHILDVAGGKGELSARLVLCCNMNVTMVDPRVADIEMVYLKQILPKLPKKWQQQYELKYQHDQQFLQHIIHKRYRQYTMYFTNETIQMNVSLQHAIENCTCIIGMHADSATECIVDIAIRYNKPFVVIPCCVFPNLFPQRFIYQQRTVNPSIIDTYNDDANNNTHQVCNDNKTMNISATTPSTTVESQNDMIMIPVRTYEQFCDYLLHKDPRFQQSILPFDGRNIAIWWDGT